MVAGSVVSSGNPPAFELHPDGTLYARQANISGTVHASSGRLNNVIIDKNCQINGTLTAMQIIGDIAKLYTCPKNGMIIVDPAPFDRQLCIMPVTLTAVGHEGWGHGDNMASPDYWSCGTLDIIIGDRINYPRGFKHRMKTDVLNLAVCWSYSALIPANSTFFIQTKTPDKHKTTGIPDFITALVLKS